jgi:hypothetical protein
VTQKPQIPKRVSRAIDRMQTAASKAGVDALFDATSEQLGAAAFGFGDESQTCFRSRDCPLHLHQDG